MLVAGLNVRDPDYTSILFNDGVMRGSRRVFLVHGRSVGRLRFVKFSIFLPDGAALFRGIGVAGYQP